MIKNITQRLKKNFNTPSKKTVYSRATIRRLIFLGLVFLLIFDFKEHINQIPSLSIILAFFVISFITINVVTIFKPNNIFEEIMHDFFYSYTLLLVIAVIAFVIYTLFQLDLIDINNKISYASVGSGVIATIGIYFFWRRLENQQKQIQIQIDQRVDERFNTAINLLGSAETSARTGAIYALYELTMEEEKYRKQIAQILCSHIRSKTNGIKYQEIHTNRPSNEIQTTIDLLFKKNGLYTQDFTKQKGFSKANLNYAYLIGADFQNAQCQEVDFSHTQCQNATFFAANCRKANFYKANCQYAKFELSHCQYSGFVFAQCQEIDFSHAKLQGATLENTFFHLACFINAKCQGTSFIGSQFQRANFNSSNCQGANFSYAECQGASFLDAKFQGAYADGVDYRVPYRLSLETRIGKNTELTNMLFAGEINAASIDAIEKFKFLYTQDAEKFAHLINKHEKNVPNCTYPDDMITGKLEDSKEIQAIINKDWEKLEQLQNAE